MFKNILISAALGTAALCSALPLHAATKVTNYAEAQNRKLVNNDGYLIIAYPDGWNRFGEKLAHKLAGSSAISKAAGKAVLMMLPIPDYTTEATKKAKADICGKLNVPGARSYPALILLDREGKHYATLCGTPVVRATEKEVAAQLAELMKKGQQRRDLLDKAEKAAKGAEKARLTFDAYQIDGLSGWGKGFANHLAKLDPKDESGVVHAANYNHYALLDKLGKMPPADAVAEVDKLLKDAAYTNRQKQQMCMAILGVLRRSGGMEQAPAMRRFARQLGEYAPETAHGKASTFIGNNWVPELSCKKGWSPAALPATTKPVALSGPVPISSAGTYTVTFTYTRGRHALNILSIELYDGNTKVAEDVHKGSTGNTHKNNVYTLKVNGSVKEPHVFISFDMQKNRDSYGTISIRQQ